MSTTSHTVKPTAMAEWVILLSALTSTQERGGSAPCLRDPGPFTSDNYRERAEAAAACAGCPALSECRAYADSQAETWHVWAGTDRTPTTRTAAVLDSTPSTERNPA